MDKGCDFLNFPYFITDNKKINSAYRMAVSTLFANILPFKDGVLEKAKPVIIAGLGYSTPWTRDAAINTWNAGGLICPEVAESTLLSVISQKENGYFIEGEYWDRIIWVIGAWQYYLCSGDREFLKIALSATENSLKFFEDTEFSEEYGLFRGPACYGDGVSAYPDIYATHGKAGIIGFACECEELCEKKGVGIPIYALSANCLYFEAYVIADKIRKEFELEPQYIKKAEALKTAINKYFWDDGKKTYRYIYDKFGGSDAAEGMGISFVVLFNIANDEQKKAISEKTYVSKHGIPCVYPRFSRYDTEDGYGRGRHSGTVWPHIQGFWASASAEMGNVKLFDSEFSAETENALRYGQFAEIYHPETGEIYGGLQESKSQGIRYWESQPWQTWSATAYLRNVYFDILGMKFDTDGIKFAPIGSNSFYKGTLLNLRYRDALLNVTIKGNGDRIKSFKINGEETEPFVPSTAEGVCNIEILMF